MYFASRALQEDGATIATLRKELHAARTQIGRLQDDVEGERAARAAAESRAGRLALLSDEDGDGSTSKQHRIDALEAALQSSEERAAEERSRAADVKALWKSVVDTLREENEALTAALAAARSGISAAATTATGARTPSASGSYHGRFRPVNNHSRQRLSSRAGATPSGRARSPLLSR